MEVYLGTLIGVTIGEIIVIVVLAIKLLNK